MKHYRNQSSHKDPVCGMEVSYKSAIELMEYRGKTYYFCAPACREAFEADPAKYIHHHRQHGIKPQ